MIACRSAASFLACRVFRHTETFDLIDREEHKITS
jgi:hypothetical protein